MNLFVTRTWLEAKFAKDERGASMVEYILLVALIALAVIAAVVFLKNQVNSKFNDAAAPAADLRPQQNTVGGVVRGFTSPGGPAGVNLGRRRCVAAPVEQEGARP
jgi:pilus assembly protein Flp/PilA